MPALPKYELGWKWPQPVLLKAIEDGPLLNARPWNPKLYASDKAHRMPIITPAYPSMCSTHNITPSTQKVMKEEFQRGALIADKVMCKHAEWKELFEPHDFFSKYRYYLQITASSGDPEIQIKWAGTVESKLRHLVMGIEGDEYGLEIVHPFIKGFDRVNYCLDGTESGKVSMGDFPDVITKRRKEDMEGVEGSLTVWTSTFYIGLKIPKSPDDQPGSRKIDLSYPTNQFTQLVKMWDGFDKSTMGIIVRYMKSSALPDHVFENGTRDRQAKSGKRRQSDKTTGHKNVKRPKGTEDGQLFKKLRPSSFVSDTTPALNTATSPLSPPLIAATTQLNSNNTSKGQGSASRSVGQDQLKGSSGTVAVQS